MRGEVTRQPLFRTPVSRIAGRQKRETRKRDAEEIRRDKPMPAAQARNRSVELRMLSAPAGAGVRELPGTGGHSRVHLVILGD